MEFYNKAYKYEKENNIDKAKYFYELSILFGEKIGLKHLEYLDKNNFIKYIEKYNRRIIFNYDFIEIIKSWYTNYKCDNINEFYNNIENLNIESINIDYLKDKFKYLYNKYKNYEPLYLYEYVAIIILYSCIYNEDNLINKHIQYIIKFIDYLPKHILTNCLNFGP